MAELVVSALISGRSRALKGASLAPSSQRCDANRALAPIIICANYFSLSPRCSNQKLGVGAR